MATKTISEPEETQTHEPTENEPLNQENEVPQTVTKKTTLVDRILKIRSSITVEPMAAFFIMPVMLAQMATQNLNLEKACRVNLNFSVEVCNALERRETENYTYYEAEVQKLTASVAAWKSVIQTSIPCAMIMFVGAWSDKTGRRKIFILLPIFGEFLTCISNMINTYFFYELPLEVLVFTEAIFPALTGGWATMFLGIFSYIGDVSSLESRTFRLGMVSFCTSVGFPIGMSLSGILLSKIGFYGVFGLSAFIQFMSFMYGALAVKDPERTPAQKEAMKKGVSFFDFERAKETFGFIFTKEPKHRCLRMCFCLGMICMLFGPMYGEITILYLFTRYRFNWNAINFSMFLTYNFVTHTIGTVFSIAFLSKYLQFHDSLLGIISTFSKIAGTFIYAFATTSKQFYLGPLVEILNGTGNLALRSILSKSVTNEEQGKMNSVIGLVETMMPLIYAPVYTRVYMATFLVLPGAVFLLSAALTIIPGFAFIYLFAEHRKNLRKTNRKSSDLRLDNPNVESIVP